MRRRGTGVESFESTFGRITVFKPADNDNDEQVKKVEVKVESKVKPVVIEQPKQFISNTKADDDFFGIETGTEYIDSKFNLNYKEPASVKKDLNEVKTTHDLSEIKDLNYFDEILTEKKEVKNSKVETTTVKNVSINDVNDLSYVDETYFKPSPPKSTAVTQVIDSTVGSIKNFRQKSKKTLNTTKTIETIRFDDVNLNDVYNEEKQKAIVETLKTSKDIKENKIIGDSFHEILKNEVPIWYKMTINEAAELLSKHVCYFNVEHGILAIDKPYGLPSFGGPGKHLSVAKLMPRLKEILKIDYDLYMMHRLDEETTGVMIFATNKEAEMKIRKLFNEHKIIKQYLAITKSVPSIKEGEINIPIIQREVNGIVKTYLSPDYNEETSLILDKPKKDNPNRKNAITRYRLIDATQAAALIECQPLTGLKHQLRVHLSYGLGCPILGDHKYSHHLKLAPQRLPDPMLKSLKIRQSKARYVPMHLHAYRIILPEFIGTRNLFIKAELPLHFKNNLKRLRLFFK